MKVTKNNREKIIGLPPQWSGDEETDHVEKLVEASFPVVQLTPAWPNSAGDNGNGLHLFSLDQREGIRRWKAIVTNSIPDGMEQPSALNDYINIAYLNEGPMTESFSQEYGGSKFEEMANMGSQTINELRQMTGKDSARDALQSLKTNMNDGLIGSALKGIVGGASHLAGFAEDTINGMSNGFGNLISGSKVDFPSIWKGAGYQSSKSITIRLYNPQPQSRKAYIKFIVWPIIQILGFVIPQSDINEEGVSATYHSPVLCSAKCPGLWEIKAGFVSGVEIIKGGESNALTFKNNPGMVDVRVSFGELYNVLTTHTTSKDRPTLAKYIGTLLDEPDVDLDIYGAGSGSIVADSDSESVSTTTGSTSENTSDVNSRVSQQDQMMASSIDTKTTAPEAQSNLNSGSESLNEPHPPQMAAINDADSVNGEPVEGSAWYVS